MQFLRCRCIALVIGLLSAGSTLAADTLLTDMALVNALRGGGFSLYFRHVTTNWSQADDVRKRDDWLSCDPQRMRQLSAEGRQDAQTIGMAIRRLNIPVTEVLASPYCRTVETAQLMELGEIVKSVKVMNLRAASYFGGRASIVATAQQLFASAPSDASNRVIVAHGNVAREATPAYPGEGEGLVFKADDVGGFSLRGRIPPDDWPRLLELAGEQG